MASKPMSIPFDPSAVAFPLRNELPRVEGQPDEAAWVWGKDDNLGRLNLLTPSRVAAAAAEIKTGDIAPLNLPLDIPNIPAFGREVFKHEIKILADEVCYDDLYTLNTQSSTQFDGFRHFAILKDKVFYNGITRDDIVGPAAGNKCSVQHWSEHGIAGRGILLDYYAYAQKKGMHYDALDRTSIGYDDLDACGRDQGLDIRPASQGGDVKIGDILLVRCGYTAAYMAASPAHRDQLNLRPHSIAPDSGQRFPGLRQEEKLKTWLHDCYFAAVAGDSPSFEAWPCIDDPKGEFLHEYILARWGMPLGELFNLEKLSELCHAHGRWTFFVTSSPANCPRGVSTHSNALAIL